MREGRLFEWTGTDKAGNAKTYQTEMPHCVTESGALEHLRSHFPNLTITAIAEVYDPKPATGIVHYHAYTHGYYDEMARANGYKIRGVDTPPTSPIVREVWSEDMRRLLVKRPPLIVRSTIR